MSGLERGGSLRFLTLTTSPQSPEDIQRSWRAIHMRMKRRGLIQGYIKVPEVTRSGRTHLHILFRGSYVSQQLLSSWWQEIHRARVVDIRSFRPYHGKKATASYMAKYMSKELAGRYSWSWGWVWRGFCHDWTSWKRYWRKNFESVLNPSFAGCLTGWKWWLRDLVEIDRDAMSQNLPPPLVITGGIYNDLYLSRPDAR